VSDKRTVVVRIRGQDFRIRSDEPAEQLQRIAQTVDETMSRVEKRTGAVDSYDVAMLTALNLAREVVGNGAGARAVDDSRLRSLIELAESAIPATAR
jgi:cell division protein ZapA (FtsZ GTPase activity inhibitor)